VVTSATLPLRPRLVQYFVSCVVLGIGVGLLLQASLGSDGYSTLVNGMSIATGLPFALINILVAAGFVAIAWLRRLPPTLSTVVQPALVGLVINGVLLFDGPDGLGWRALLLACAFPVVAIGVAGYLGSGAGAGPTEAVALAFDPPLPFRWSYSIMQGTSALVGWLLGGAFGVGTALVIFLLGPVVDLVSARVPRLNVEASNKHLDAAGGAAAPGAIPCEL
jgi:uncharacterized membrane protein YczE